MLRVIEYYHTVSYRKVNELSDSLILCVLAIYNYARMYNRYTYMYVYAYMYTEINMCLIDTFMHMHV